MLSKHRSELFGVNGIRTFSLFSPFLFLKQTIRGNTTALYLLSSTVHVQMIISVQSEKDALRLARHNKDKTINHKESCR